MNLEEFHKTLTAFDAKCDTRERANLAAREEESDLRILEALARGMRAVEELDPIVRETMRDDPAALAEWDEIMHMCDDLDEDRPDNSADSSAP